MIAAIYRTLERTRQPNFGGLAARWDADVMVKSVVGHNSPAVRDNMDAEVHSGAHAT